MWRDCATLGWFVSVKMLWVRLRWSDAHLRAGVPPDLPDTLRYPPLRVGTARAPSPVTREDGHFARVPVTSRELQHARSDPKTREVARRNDLVADRMDIIGFPLERQTQPKPCSHTTSRTHQRRLRRLLALQPRTRAPTRLAPI